MVEMERECKSEFLYIGMHKNDTEIADIRLFQSFQDEGVKVRKDV